MSTQAVDKEPSQQQNEPSTHYFHAEAHALSGELEHPIKQTLPRLAQVVLKNSRRSDHITETVDATNLEGLVSVTAAHSRVSGVKVEKKARWATDHSGWITLSTSIVEGLNVFEIVTADRVVSQVSTEHPFVQGHVPRVTFLGTQFKNLAVSGFPVPLELDLAFCGKKPKQDRPYLLEPDFLRKAQKQTAKVCGMLGVEVKGLDEILKMIDAEEMEEFKTDMIAAQVPGDRRDETDIPTDLKKCFAGRLEEINRLINDRENGREIGPEREITCSLVKKIGPIPIPGVYAVGNVLVIPDFGWVGLAEIKVGIKPAEKVPYGEKENGNQRPTNYFTLTMLDMQLGCVGGGNLQAATSTANGSHGPGH